MLDRITPPEVRPFGKLSLPGMRPVILDNGIRLNVYDHSFQDVSELTVLVPGGVVDVLGSPVASMLVPVMLDGSHAYPDSALSDIFDFNGAKISPSVTDHYTSVSMRMLNSHWPELLPVFADMLLAPQLSERAVAICKQRVGQSAAIAMQRVEYKAEQELRRLTYGPEHPKTQMDTPERIEAVTCEDFHAWHDRLFRQNIGGAELFLSGRVTPGMIADVNRVFGSIHIDSVLAIPPYIQPFRPTAPSTAFVESPGALQSAIRFAIPSIPRSHPDYIMLRCAVVALGGYFGSRLMTNIREDKGYTYGIQAGLLGSPEGTFMVVQTSADNMYVEAVLAEIDAEIERLYSADFTSGEMERLRQYLMSALAQHLDTAFSISSCHITERVAFTGPDYFARQFHTVSTMTAEQLGDVARRHLPLHDKIVVVAGEQMLPE